MDAVSTVSGTAIPLDRADVDTDQIIPAKYLKRIERVGYGPFAFEAWRKDPDFVVNQPQHKGASILLAGPNFGCGSSREHAVWAIQQMGVGAVISSSFADIFRNNSAKMGLLTVVLDRSDVQYLMARAEELPGSQITVDQSLYLNRRWLVALVRGRPVRQAELAAGPGRHRSHAQAGVGDYGVRGRAPVIPADQR